MKPALRILSPGPLTSVQDLGRPGHQRLGVPAGGALDPVALRAGNALAGNAPDVGALECVGVGPTLIVEAESVRLAVVGGGAPVWRRANADEARETPVEPGVSFTLLRGERLRVGTLTRGATAYIAVEGGFDIAPVLGSVSTYVRGEIGGFEGRPLRAGDRVPLAQPAATPRREREMTLDFLAPVDTLRVVEGPQADFFEAEQIEAFHAARYRIGAQWSRMGARLEGPALPPARGFNIVSDAIVRGSIQIPGGGQPIVLMSEHQTTGGYPKIATVISADLHLLGRLGPGDSVRFRRVTMEEAAAARALLTAELEALPSRTREAQEAADPFERLFDVNLISGVFDAGPSWS